MTDSNDLRHRLVDVPGGRIHLVEQGEGPLVLFVHGFPESWYSWRHQLPALAGAGYRAVAIDVRGYGRSMKPTEVSAYRMLAHVADNVGVVQALGAEQAIIVGHDWGAPIAATSALVRPEVFRAVGLLSVPYSPPGGPRPTDLYRRVGGDDEFYMSYFQAPGRAEAEIEADLAGWLAGVYRTLTGGVDRPAGSPFFIPRGSRMVDRFALEPERPDWLTAADLAFYVDEFERTGVTGPLNRYRNVDRDWEDLAAWNGAPLRQPSLYIAGGADESTTWLAAAIRRLPQIMPGLRGSHLLPGVGHWVQQERPDEVNRLLLDWLDTIPATADRGVS